MSLGLVAIVVQVAGAVFGSVAGFAPGLGYLLMAPVGIYFYVRLRRDRMAAFL